MDRVELLQQIKGFANEQLISHFIPGKTYIPPAAPTLDVSDVVHLGEVLLQFWYTEWKYCRKFERELEKATGKKHVVLVNSGSSASLIALASAKLAKNPSPEKRYILTCATGFPTTVSPIYQNGYIPMYVDMDPLKLTPDIDQIREIMSGPNRDLIAGAVFAHTLGFPFDEMEIRSMLRKDQFFISDCCDALGAKTGNSPVGTWADISFLSFFPSHHIMAGEGGAVLTDSDEIAEAARSLSNWGRSCFCRPGESNTCGKRFCWPNDGDLPDGWDHKYIFDHLGYNLKMTEFQGALGYSQIQRLDSMVQSRKDHYKWLYDQLNRPEYRKYISLYAPTEDFSPFGFPIRAISGFDVNDLIADLENHKVGTRRLFGGNLIRQPAFMHQPHIPPRDSLGSDLLMENLFWISVSPSLTQDMLDYMVYVIDRHFVDRGLV